MKNIALHILDLAENSVAAAATKISISIEEDLTINRYRLTIEDNGFGMETAQLEKATDPFYTSRKTRKVGLGLPLIQMNTERTGGTFQLDSSPGRGTKLIADFKMNHVDRLPLGEIEEVLVLLAMCHPNIELVYLHKTLSGSYCFNSLEIKNIVGSLENINTEIKNFIKDMIIENLQEIHAEP